MPRITVPKIIQSLLILLFTAGLFLSPLFYSPFTTAMVKSVEDNTVNGFIIIGGCWLLVCFGCGIFLTRVIFFILPIKI